MEKRNNGWIPGSSFPPREKDGDKSGKIFVWHAYQGVMLVRWDEYSRNPFHVYWMRVSDGTGTWIDASVTAPCKADSDALNCVLAMDVHGEILVTGYHQFSWNSDLTHWQRLPDAPGDYKALRKMQ